LQNLRRLGTTRQRSWLPYPAHWREHEVSCPVVCVPPLCTAPLPVRSRTLSAESNSEWCAACWWCGATADSVREKLPCKGAWINAGTKRRPLIGIAVAVHADDPELVPDAAAAAEFDDQLECPPWLAEQQRVAAAEEQYAVVWEGGSGSFDVWSAGQVRDARLPCTVSGEPLFARALHGERAGEVGVVVDATAASVVLRFQSEYPEHDGEVIAGEPRRPPVRQMLRGRRSEELRIEMYAFRGELPGQLDDLDAFLQALLLEIDLGEVCEEWPACARTAASLVDPHMSEAEAAALVGAQVLHSAGEQVHKGCISRHSRSLLGDWQFYIEFDDGDHVSMRAPELLDRLDWAALAGQARTAPGEPAYRSAAAKRSSPVAPEPALSRAQEHGRAMEEARRRRAARGAGPQGRPAAPTTRPPAQVRKSRYRARSMEQRT
jgi:hypothetical protein